VQVFHGVVHEGALLPTLLCSLQRYYPNITIIWDGRICMFAVLLRFTLSFVYKVFLGFFSLMRDWTVAVAQHSTYMCIHHDIELKLSEYFLASSQTNWIVSRNRHALREPYCRLSSPVCNATIPTLPLWWPNLHIRRFVTFYIIFCLYRLFIAYAWLDSCCSTVFSEFSWVFSRELSIK
jgi:hypothetical protein